MIEVDLTYAQTVQPAIHICRNPVFVIGAPRSGTTALAFALAQHRHMWTSEETQILWDLFSNHRLDMNYRRENQLGGSWLQRHGIERQEFLSYLGLGLNALFTAQSGGKRWIDHTPVYTLLVDDLVDLFPDAFFIHILRDGRRVVRSMIHYRNRFSSEGANLRDELLPSWATDFQTACATWSQFVETAMAFERRYPARCLTVTNEELVTATQQTLARIFDFIRLEPEEAPIHYLATHRINSSFQQEAGSTGRGEALLQQADQIWEEWTPQQRQTFLETAGETLARYCGIDLALAIR